MQNPFESGHIKNYLLFYASIVVIMILFFIASSLFLDIDDVEIKVFNSDINESLHVEQEAQVKEEQEVQKRKFKLLPKNY